MPDDIMSLLNFWAIVGVFALAVVLLGFFVTRGLSRLYQRHRYDRDRYVRRNARETASKARHWQKEISKLQARARRSDTA